MGTQRTDMFIQRNTFFLRGRMSSRQRNREYRVRAEPVFVFCAVKRDEHIIKRTLVVCTQTDNRLCNFTVYIQNRLQNPFPAVAGITVTKFMRLIAPR